MNRYFIEEVKCDWTGGCGPCGGVSVVTTSVKFKNEDGTVQWLTLNEVDGMLSFYLSDEELFDKFLSYDEMDEDDEGYDELNSLVNDEYLTEFEGIELSCEDDSDYYMEMFEELEDNYAVQLLKYAICVSGCVTNKLEELIKAAAGKYIDDVVYDPEDVCTE